MKVEVAVWAPVPNKPTLSVDVKQHTRLSSLPVYLKSRRVCTITVKTKLIHITDYYIFENYVTFPYVS